MMDTLLQRESTNREHSVANPPPARYSSQLTLLSVVVVAVLGMVLVDKPQPVAGTDRLPRKVGVAGDMELKGSGNSCLLS